MIIMHFGMYFHLALGLLDLKNTYHFSQLIFDMYISLFSAKIITFFTYQILYFQFGMH